MKIDPSGWKEFRLGSLVDTIYKAVPYDSEMFDYQTYWTMGAVPYVTRTESDNSVKAKVLADGAVNIEDGNAITIGDTTSTIAYQPHPFITGEHIIVIRAKWLNDSTGLFITTILRRERYRYSYGRAYKINLIKDTMLRLPVTTDGSPDWQWVEDYISSLHSKPLITKNIYQPASVNTNEWKWFKLQNLFSRFEVGKGHDTILEDGDECFYLGAKKSDNGIMRTCAMNEDLVQEGNCIVFICNGAGSVGYANYMDKPFIGTTDLVMGYADWLNPWTGLFVTTVLCKERFKYSFGRKWKTHLRETEIKLPATADGNPDWQWMENYIKSLPYGDRL